LRNCFDWLPDEGQAERREYGYSPSKGVSVVRTNQCEFQQVPAIHQFHREGTVDTCDVPSTTVFNSHRGPRKQSEGSLAEIELMLAAAQPAFGSLTKHCCLGGSQISLFGHDTFPLVQPNVLLPTAGTVLARILAVPRVEG
jgi:hypothetical protein